MTNSNWFESEIPTAEEAAIMAAEAQMPAEQANQLAQKYADLETADHKLSRRRALNQLSLSEDSADNSEAFSLSMEVMSLRHEISAILSNQRSHHDKSATRFT